MKNAILLHGWSDKQEFYDPDQASASNAHWYPWLTKQLMIRDIHTVAPEMPNGYYPEYAIWKRELERFDITPETILVGHSCGGGFLLRWLSENPDQKVGKVVLVAPWIGVRFTDEPFDYSFFDFELRRNLAEQTDGLYLLHSTDDFPAILESVKIIKNGIDSIQYKEFNNKGHFTKTDLGTETFPELLDILTL